MHANHGLVSYAVGILSPSILLFARSGLPILWSVVTVVVVVVVDLVTISVKTSGFRHRITFSGSTDFHKILELVNHVFKYISANFVTMDKPIVLTCFNEAAKTAIFQNICIFLVGAGKHILEAFKNDFTSSPGPLVQNYCMQLLLNCFCTALPALRAEDSKEQQR